MANVKSEWTYQAKENGKHYIFGYRKSQQVFGVAEDNSPDPWELRWLNACTEVRLHNQQAQHLRVEQMQKDKTRARRTRRKALLRFIAWQATGSVLSALLLCCAVYAGLTLGWLSAVIPATLALFIQQEVGRRSL